MGQIVDRRVLISPSSEKKYHKTSLASSKWEYAILGEWLKAWNDEIERTPKVQESRVFMISGLLLPVWTTIKGQGSSTVYQATLDNEERILGRVVKPEELSRISKEMGLSSKVDLSAEEIYRAVLDDGQRIQLGGGLTLSRRLIDSQHRIFVKIGTQRVSRPLMKRLESYGCFSEIVNSEALAFVPVHNMRGPFVIDQLKQAFGATRSKDGASQEAKQVAEIDRSSTSVVIHTGQLEYPEAINTPEIQALYDLFRGDEGFALTLDELIKKLKKTRG